MRISFKLIITSMIVAFSSYAQAGTINAGIFFSEDCLAKIAYQPIPKKLQFSCNQDGQCFAYDLPMNALLRCAQAFGDHKLSTTSMTSYTLSSKGWVKK